DERRELAAEPRLADARRSDERDEMRTPLGDTAPPDRLEQLELAIPADQRRGAERAICGGRRRLHGQPCFDRIGLALRLHRIERLVANRLTSRAIRLGTDDDTPTRRGV